MAVVYCEVCGVLVPGGQGGQPTPRGVICGSCLESRRAIVPDERAISAGGGDGEAVQFSCCYCASVLRLHAVSKRTKIKCPGCNGLLFLHPDGRIEAQHEAGTTAVLMKAEVKPLTPSAGNAGPPSKTQPIRRLEPLEPADQDRLLEELKPRALEFLEGLPERQGKVLIDTDSFASPPVAAAAGRGPRADDLDLLPPGVGPGEVGAAADGPVDLDPEGLRRKTERFQRGGRTSTRKVRRRDDLDPGAGATAPAEPGPSRAEERAERERRAQEAALRAAELEATRARRTLRALAVWSVFLVPFLLSLLLLDMARRGSGFVSRGAPGAAMHDLGESMDRGARALNGLLPPGLRIPGLEVEGD